MTLFNEIVQKVNEELGVSNEVSDAVNYLISLVANDVKRPPTSRDSFKRGEIKNVEFFGKKCTLTYDVLFVRKRDIARYVQAPTSTPGYYDEKKNVFHTTLYYIGDEQQYVDYGGVTQHEMEHFYQLVKTGKETFLNQEQDKLYYKAVGMMHSYNYGERIVGLLIYFSCRYEEAAFLNTFYKAIMNRPNDEPIYVIKDSYAYQCIREIKFALKDVTSAKVPYYKSQVEAACKKTVGKDINWFINTANKTVKRYMRCFGRAITKAKLDLERANNGENEA